MESFYAKSAENFYINNKDVDERKRERERNRDS